MSGAVKKMCPEEAMASVQSACSGCPVHQLLTIQRDVLGRQVSRWLQSGRGECEPHGQAKLRDMASLLQGLKDRVNAGSSSWRTRALSDSASVSVVAAENAETYAVVKAFKLQSATELKVCADEGQAIVWTLGNHAVSLANFMWQHLMATALLPGGSQCVDLVRVCIQARGCWACRVCKSSIAVCQSAATRTGESSAYAERDCNSAT